MPGRRLHRYPGKVIRLRVGAEKSRAPQGTSAGKRARVNSSEGPDKSGRSTTKSRGGRGGSSQGRPTHQTDSQSGDTTKATQKVGSKPASEPLVPKSSGA